MKKVMFLRALLVVMCLGFCLVFLSQSAVSAAPAYPERDIRFIISWSAGGGTDVVGRQIASQMEKILGVNIIVDNILGGSGAVGFKVGADSPADGYTWIMGATPMLLQKHNGGTFVDYALFDHIAIFNADPASLIVPKNSSNTLAEFVEYAVANPGRLTCANSGVGNTWHVTGIQFEKLIGTSFIHVPYANGLDAAVAVAGGHVDLSTVSAAEAATLVETGEAKFLAIASEERDPSFPDVPTFREQGIDLVNGTCRWVAVPTGTDPQIIGIIEDALKQVYESEEFRTFMRNGKFGVQWKSGEELQTFLDESDAEYAVLFETISIE